MNTQWPCGILFDLGGTVIQGSVVDARAGNTAMLALADDTNGVTPEDVMRVVEELYDWCDLARDESRIELSFQAMQRYIFGILGVHFSVDFLELERAFWNAATHYEPVPGIYGLLDVLDEFSIRIGILSNSTMSERVLLEELEKHNLSHRFSFLVSSADYSIRKPHPFIYRVALCKLGLDKDKMWFVGDKPEYDIKGALDIGIFPVWFNQGREARTLEGDYLEVASLDELRQMLLRLE